MGLKAHMNQLRPTTQCLGSPPTKPTAQNIKREDQRTISPHFKTLGWRSVGGKLMERDNGCTLMMVVGEWRSGMRAATCELQHGQANDDMGMVEVQQMWEEYVEIFSFLIPSHFSYPRVPSSHSLYPHHNPCIILTFLVPLNFLKSLIFFKYSFHFSGR